MNKNQLKILGLYIDPHEDDKAVLRLVTEKGAMRTATLDEDALLLMVIQAANVLHTLKLRRSRKEHEEKERKKELTKALATLATIRPRSGADFEETQP